MHRKKNSKEVIQSIKEEMFAGKHTEKEDELDWSFHEIWGLLKLVLEGRREGRKTRGRPRLGDDLWPYEANVCINEDGGFSCRGPANEERTNDDDDDHCFNAEITLPLLLGVEN